MSAVTKIFSNLYLDKILAPWFCGQGVILMFHRIVPDGTQNFRLGLRGLEVTQSFFGEILDYFVSRKFQFLSATALGEWMKNGSLPQRFVVITFDDGYIDNATFVGPLMQRRGLPWTLYVTTNAPDRTIQPWWYALGDVIKKNHRIDMRLFSQSDIELNGASEEEKDHVYDRLRFNMHARAGDGANHALIEKWFVSHGVDLSQLTENLFVSWKDLVNLASMGCDMGAHTLQHPNLSILDEKSAWHEIIAGKARLEIMLQKDVSTFAYPFGDRASAGQREFDLAKKAGFTLGLTTRNGWLFADHVDFPHALPRINVSGSFRSWGDFRSRLNGLASLRESGLRRVVTQ